MTSSTTPPLAERRFLPSWWPLAGLFALLLLLAALRPLALPDEGRYGEVGRWMAASGDWLAPRLNGLPFFHKPPLLYWLEAASVTLFGATPWALRLVPALHAGLMLMALFGAVRALGRFSGDAAGGARLARSAALMLAASPAFLLGGQYVNHDMMVATWISVAIWCFALAFLRADARRRPQPALALMGFAACALGVLSKGLIGLVLPGLVLFIWLLWTRRFGLVWRLPWLRGLLLFAAIAVPWFVLAERRFPGMVNYMFGVQQFTRYTSSGGFNNVQPWWFYLPCLVLLLFPWALFALAQAVAQVRRRALPAAQGTQGAAALPRELLSLCWIWIAAIVGFFSIPQSKLVGYVLPVMPPLALLAAAGWQRYMTKRRTAPLWGAALAVLALAIVCTVNVMAGRHSSRASTQGIAHYLARAAAPGDALYIVGGYPYDLAFHARLQRPPIVVQDWASQRVTAGDVWQRELFEAGDFDPAQAAQVLQSPPAALQAASTAPRAWVVAPADRGAGLDGLRRVTQDGYWVLYASPALAAALGNAQ